MKRSHFSFVMFVLAMAFLYVPLMMVFVFGFVPNGTMSFYGPGATRTLDPARSQAVSVNPAWKADGDGFAWTSTPRFRAMSDASARLQEAERALNAAWADYYECAHLLNWYHETASADAGVQTADAEKRWRQYYARYLPAPESGLKEPESAPERVAWLRKRLQASKGDVRACKGVRAEAALRLDGSMDGSPKAGEIRMFLEPVRGRPFAALVVDTGFFGDRIVPLSPHAEPASSRELRLAGHVFQLWNACSPTEVARSIVVERVDPAVLAQVRGALDAAAPQSCLDASGRADAARKAVARYEKAALATDLRFFLGFTDKWYRKVFSGSADVKPLVDCLWLSLIIAGLSTLISCVIGTTSALALHRWRDRLQTIHHALVYTPLVMPDILIGISLLMLFVAAHVECGFWTILIAHVTFCVSYVAMTVLARLQDFDDRITEAAYDLGAGPWYTFFHVELPILLPGIVAGGLLAFTLSIDDVVITSFINGAGTNTFPTYVSSMVKHSKNLPAVFSISTLMLIFTCLLVAVSKLLTRKNQDKLKGSLK